jgi:protein-disulfide isomerase
MASGKATKRKRAAERPQAPARRDTGPDDRRLWVVAAVAAAVVVAAVAGVLLTRDEGDDAAVATTLPGAAEVTSLFRGVPQDGAALGGPDAPVTLVEFVDLQCPFCREFEEAVPPQLVADEVREGRLRIETRGLAFLGPDSERGLRAILAAGLQRKHYELKALLYANQGPENSGWLSQDLVEAAARSVPGFDVSRLAADMESDAVDEQVADHAAEAERRGVNSTPTILVGPTSGELQRVQMEGPADLQAIEDAIAAAAG